MSIFPSSMPYDDINIIDQSGYIEETVVESPEIPSGPIAFIPFISPRGYGEDNKLQYMNANKLNKFGNPNLKKYGLSLYLAKRFIEGGGTVLGMRVTTDDYAYANFCISAIVDNNSVQCKYETIANSITGKVGYYPKFKVTGNTDEIYFEEITLSNVDDFTSLVSGGSGDSVKLTNGSSVSITDESGTAVDATVEISESGVAIIAEYKSDTETHTKTYNMVTDKTLTVKYIKRNISGATSIDMVKTLFKKEIEDTNKNKDIEEIPLFIVASKGAGEYANNFKARFAVDSAMNSYIDTTAGDAFCYKFIDSDGNAKLDGSLSFTFNDDYLYQGKSMCIEEVFNTYTENVTMIKMDEFDDFLKTVKSHLETKGIITDDSDMTINKVDVLFGSNIDSNVYHVITSGDDSANLADTKGIQFNGGTEVTDPFDFKDDPYAEALAAAFNGEAGEDGDLIYDQIRYPYQYIFCPSADSDVMEAVHNLVTVNRKCTRAHYFVTGKNSVIPGTYADARSQRDNIPADSWKEDIIPEWARITDTYTGRKVFMPSVYFTAYAIPKHWNNRKGKPLAGPKNCIWNGFDIGTVKPHSANTNEYIENHNVQYNTMIEDGIGNAVMYEQTTAQKNPSRLSEINNAQVLCEMVKIALKLASDNRWSDLGDAEINTYKEQVETSISAALKNCYQTMSVVATRESVNGAGRNRILCKINVLFKDMLKGVSYEFYILAN